MITVDFCTTEGRILPFVGKGQDVARNRRVVITLDAGEYERLERVGAAQDRDAWQQARWLLRQALQEQRDTPGDGQKGTDRAE